MPQELVIVDMKGFYNFPWGRGKGASHNTKGDRVLQGIKAHSSKDKSTDKDDKKVEDVGNDTDKYLDDSDDEMAIAALDAKVEAERVETAAKNILSGTVDKSNAETVDTNVEDCLEVGNGSEERTEVCNVQKESEVNSESVDDKTEGDQLGTEKDKDADASATTAGPEVTILTTKHSNIIIPMSDPIPETNIENCIVSAIASRTLLSLRRAEDCSFEDIRIFNAQDNFVVNSCEIGIKIQDHSGEDNGENGSIRMEKKSNDVVDNDGRITSDTDVENPDDNGSGLSDKGWYNLDLAFDVN